MKGCFDVDESPLFNALTIRGGPSCSLHDFHIKKERGCGMLLSYWRLVGVVGKLLNR